MMIAVVVLALRLPLFVCRGEFSMERAIAGDLMVSLNRTEV